MRLIDWFEQAPPQLRVAAPSLAQDAGGTTGHAFLLGFHRSGTTLIEQVLAAHPGVVRVVANRAVDGGWELVTEHGGQPLGTARVASPAAVARE